MYRTLLFDYLLLAIPTGMVEDCSGRTIGTPSLLYFCYSTTSLLQSRRRWWEDCPRWTMGTPSLLFLSVSPPQLPQLSVDSSLIPRSAHHGAFVRFCKACKNIQNKSGRMVRSRWPCCFFTPTLWEHDGEQKKKNRFRTSCCMPSVGGEHFRMCRYFRRRQEQGLRGSKLLRSIFATRLDGFGGPHHGRGDEGQRVSLGGWGVGGPGGGWGFEQDRGGGLKRVPAELDCVNPLKPCGACMEWLKKIAEVNPDFKVITFTDSGCQGVYIEDVAQIV